MSDLINVNVNGRDWHLYSASWSGPDGKYAFTFYAISDEHAALVLEDIKATAQLDGRIWGVIPA